jgi:hypothetical protein
MISQNDYQIALGQIGPKFNNLNINWHSWYMQYSYYESMWNNYFHIFLTNYSTVTPHLNIRFVFWESCPGGMPFPHPNYAFDSNRFNNPIHGTFDSYIKNECVRFGSNWQMNNVKRNIGDILIELAQKGVLIIDLYPTHGVSLDTTNRQNLFANLFGSYSIDKLMNIGSKTSTCLKNDNDIKVTEELWNAGINNNMNNTLKTNIQNALGLNGPPNFYK